MQCLYAMRTGNDFPFPVRTGSAKKTIGNSKSAGQDADTLLRRQFDATISLFSFQIWFLTEVARYAETDARLRSSRHLPTAEDMAVPVKIAGNELLWRILESGYYLKAIPALLPPNLDAGDQIRKVYLQLSKSTAYALYNATPGRDKKAEKEILEYILNDLMLANEDWVSFVEEQYVNWDDDAEMLHMLLMQFLQKPGSFSPDEMIAPDKVDFACRLMETVNDKRDVLDEWITPKLHNWDADRLAQLDMILLEMGVAEFLYFETIPPKVTINEYIDLAKAYSTHLSGQFINGILDNIRKELEDSGKLQKVAFKKI